MEKIIEDAQKGNDENFETSIYDLNNEEQILKAIKTIHIKKFENSKGMYKVELVRGELISRNKTIEVEMQRRVAAETIDVPDKKTGEMITKKRYTNEFLREAAIKVLLDNNAEYNGTNKQLDQLDRWLKARVIVISFQRDTLKSAIILASLMGDK